ncbi:MAG TPA: PGF-pre-PGF domain-containing protein [Methanosarcina sp.]|nr:PGF-pre-PGF domain-containing protein [Methanosarcina sp.]
MENKRKLYSITLASTALVFMFLILILILISSVASASQVAAQVTRIGNGSDPAIYGSKVVWTDSGVIHVYDLTSKTDITVSSSAAFHPAIYGNKLVWHDESSGVPRLTVYDIPSGARSYITQDVDNYSFPAIYGNRIVWSANYNKSSYNYNVYMRDISTSTQTKIAEGNSPDIYDTKIAYGYEDDYGRTIAVYDINTKETINIHSSSQVFSPYIYGNKVIWSDFYSRDGYIQMYDLVTNETIDVTSDNTGNTLSIVNEYGYNVVDAGDDTGTHININGDKIVYSKSGDDQFGYAGVYVYDIPSAKSTPVYIYPRETYTTPDIYNDIIVWGIGSRIDVANDNGIYMSNLSATNILPPVAEFHANVTSGTVPLVVRFTDFSTGGVPTSWYWDFGDGTNSKHATNATHTFTNPGVYNVTLIVENEAGNSTVTKPNYITVTPPQPPVADFSTNVTSGTAPLTVLFAATSKGGATSKVEEPISWYWDFGDGTNSTDSATVHKFTEPENYTISLTVGNIIGNNTTTRPDYIVVTDPNAPVANFNSNVTEGYAPLTVQFNDLSQKATSRIWDFNGDEQPDSSDTNPVYIYANAGTYTVNLTVNNANGTASKTAAINVLTPSGSNGDSSNGGSSHNSGGGGGGAGGSPEPQTNVQVKELSKAQVSNGKPVKFDFAKNATCVVYVSFDSKKTAGKITTIAEQLKAKSTLVSPLNLGEVYKYFNLWVGNSGFATPNNIENPVVCFKVEKAWIQDKKIDESSIVLSMFSDKKWDQLSTSLSGKDDKYLYFTAKTPGFSFFAITGKTPVKETNTGIKHEPNTESIKGSNESSSSSAKQTPEQKQSLNTSGTENTKTPGFEITSCIFCLLSLFLYKRR